MDKMEMESLLLIYVWLHMKNWQISDLISIIETVKTEKKSVFHKILADKLTQ